VHRDIILPIIFHAAFTALIVYIDEYHHNLGLPGSIIPSLSIVVGLMLVFRNNASYDRFWQGRTHFTGILSDVRGLVRTFLAHSRGPEDEASEEEQKDTETTVRILIALLYATKNNLRAEFLGVASNPPGTPWLRSGNQTPAIQPHASNGNGTTATATATDEEQQEDYNYFNRNHSFSRQSTQSHPNNHSTLLNSSVLTLHAEYSYLLPPTILSLEDQGLALPIQLLIPIECYIRRGLLRQWWAAPQAAQLTATLTSLTTHYGAMETIKLTPIPVAHLIHTRQVLALYLLVLPFGLVENMGWWAVPVVGVVAFTLYGIEGIGRQLEDPFGYDRNDIKMDAIVEDFRVEVEALLDEWRRGYGRSGLWG
jgi:putative membrane protein